MDALDKLYKDKFKDFTQDPLPGAFDKINAQLPKGSTSGGTSSHGWKSILSSKSVLIKIIAAIAVLSVVTYVIVKLSSQNELKNTPEQKEESIPIDTIQADTLVPSEENKSTTEIEKRANKKNKKIITTNNSIPIIDSTLTEPSIAKDSITTSQKEEPKTRKAKRQKKYEDFYKKSTNKTDSTINLFK